MSYDVTTSDDGNWSFYIINDIDDTDHMSAYKSEGVTAIHVSASHISP